MKRKFAFRIFNTVLGILSLVGSLTAQDLKPVVTMTIQNVQTIAEALPAMAQAADDKSGGIAAVVFQSFVSQDAFKDAIDVQRPAGLFLIPTAPKQEPMPIVVLPIKDVEKAGKLLPPAFAFEKTAENCWKVSCKGEDGKPTDQLICCVYVKGDWCFLTQKENEVVKASECAEFKQLLASEAAGRDLGATLFVNGVLESERQELCEGLVQNLLGGIDCNRKCMGESMANFFREELEKFLKSAKDHHYESPISEARLSYCWNADAKKLVIRNSFTGNAENGQIQDLSRVVKGGESALINFGTAGTLASCQFNASIAEMKDPVVVKLLAMRHEQIKKRIAKCHGEEAANEICGFFEKNGELFLNAFFGPEIESAGAVYANKEQLTLVGARVVPDGYALEKTFQTAINYIKTKKADKIDAHVKDAKRVEEGDLHIFQANFVPDHPLPKKIDALFGGKVPACVIFTPKAAYYALGTDACETLKKCIANAKSADAPVFSARVSAQNALEVVACQKEVPADLLEKLRKVGDSELTVKVVSLENGMEVVTEIPAQIFRMMVLCRDRKCSEK